MVPKFGDMSIVLVEQGGIANIIFNAIDRTVENMATTQLFSFCKPNPYREMTR